ncbi:Pre-rRNA-processing protein ipi3 [Tulasnella sp. 418]|nr:Pre-rRNA-processing protein ipi3 [Tulasnella sp. 418]
MKLQEVIICSLTPVSSAQGSGYIALHDIQTGTSLASFKQTSCGSNLASFIRTGAGQGGLILTAQSEKPLLHVYSFQKDQLHLKIVLPEKLSCITTDPLGHYCAGGTPNGRIYLWEIASGILFNTFEAHYRCINVLRFTLDGAALVSGSEDSGVSVWAMARLLDNNLQYEIPTPYCMFSDHTLSVTDIQCGIGNFPKCRILTSSLDNSCKLWDIETRTLLTTFLFPKPLSLLAFDRSERTFFAASSDGSIHQVNLFREPKDKFGRGVGVSEAVGGLGPGDPIRISDEVDDSGPTTKRLISVGKPISSLAISLTSSNLLVGTSTGHLEIYDIPSHQLIRTISTHQGYSITNITTMLKPPDLIGHTTLGSGSHHDAIPVKPISSFQRVKDQVSRDVHEVPIILPVPLDQEPPYHISPNLGISEGMQYFMNLQSESADASSAQLQSRVSQLEAEVSSLRQSLSKAKGLSDAMWEVVVNKMLNSDQGEDEVRLTKKTKT